MAADVADFDPPVDELFAYGLVHPKADAWRVTVIFSDGRAFFRTIRADADMAPRVLATTLVNLVRSGEEGTIEPDATQAPPDFFAPRDVLPPELEEAVTPPRRPGPDIGLGLQGALVMGMGPPTDTDIVVGGVGGLEVGIRSLNGVVVTLGARTLTRTERGHRMLRVQASGAAGYGWRWRAFELVALGYVSVEPWFLLSSAGRESTRTSRPEDSSSSVLLGGGARLSPGYRFAVSPKHALRLGLRVEAGGSAMAPGGVGRITTQSADGSVEPLFRLGGFEVATGLELVWWFGTAARP